jgi:putative phosphoribosyl transferase
LAAERPVVVALARGGVPVGVEVAAALGAPLDVLAVRKLGAPGNPEFGVGAVAEDGIGILDADSARRVGLTQERFELVLGQESRELRRRVEAYRHGRPPVDVRGRTVIVVDDGLATGLTDLAAVRSVRGRGADRIVVAAPVGSREAIAVLEQEADAVVCHTIPAELRGVGAWYADFSPVPDHDVIALLDSASRAPSRRVLAFDIDDVTLGATLVRPPHARGLVIFAHDTAASRHSPRNRAVARTLQQSGFATLLLDLLSDTEEGSRDLVLDIGLLARRVALVVGWAEEDPGTAGLPIGLFGVSTGAAAALRAAAEMGSAVRAVVSRGGRPDLAAERLGEVRAPTLLIVGGADPEMLALNRGAAERLRCPHRIEIVRGAGDLFTGPGELEAVTRLARDWFAEFLLASSAAPAAVGA